MKAIQIILAVICGLAAVAFLAAGCLWANAGGNIVPMLIAGVVMAAAAIGTRVCNGI